MEPKEKKKNIYSGQDKDILEEFFKSLNLSFKSASMYFRNHPSFIKSITELKKKLDKLASVRRVLDIGIAQDDLLLDGKYLGAGKLPYREIALYLHRRKIKSLRIYPSVSLDNLADFISKVALSLKGMQEGISVIQAVGNIKDIEIEELDYSFLLHTTGVPVEDVWKVLLNKDMPVSKDLTQYFAGNIGAILKHIDESYFEEEKIDTFFDNLERISNSLEDFPKEVIEEFSNNTSVALHKLPEKLLKMFLGTNKFMELKNTLSNHADKDILLTDFTKQLLHVKKYNPLFLDFYNTIFKDKKSQEVIVEDIHRVLLEKQSVQERERISRVLKEIILENPSDKFVSFLYEKTLSGLKESTAISGDEKIIAELSKDLSVESISVHYVHTLMELIKIEDKNADLLGLLSSIEKMVPFILDSKNILLIKELIGLVEDKKKASDNREIITTLEDFSKRVFSEELLDFILDNLDTIEDLETLRFILTRIKDAPRYLIKEFLENSDVAIHRKLKQILEALADESMTIFLKEALQQQLNLFILKEIIEILSRIETEDALSLLEQIYQAYKDNKIISLEILRAIRLNPYKKESFLKPLIADKNHSLRKEAISTFLEITQDREKIASFINELLNIRNFLGMRDELIIQNIEILLEFSLPEMIPFLKKFVLTKPLFFKNKRDKLRIKSLEGLIKIDSEQVKPLVSVLARDSNEKIKALIQTIKEKWQT